MHRSIKLILQGLATGYIFVYYSEHLFWARLRPDNTFLDFIWTWLAYSLMAFAFLTIIAYFKITDIWRLFLAGAAFGWLGEGLVVQTAYEQLPLSISFTGLAWHALITVWLGWYAVRKSFFSPNPLATLELAGLIGVGYGLWAISWWLEPDGGVSTLPEFFIYSMVSTLIVILAYYLANWSASELFKPDRWLVIVISGLFLLYFIFVTIPASPIAAIVLPLLFGLIFLGLRKNAATTGENSLVETLHTPLIRWKPLSLLALPVVSVGLYAFALSKNLQWHTNWVLYLITTPLGFIFFLYSLYKSMVGSHQTVESSAPKSTPGS